MDAFAGSGGIDCDIHPAAPTVSTLLPYLDEHWREHVVIRGLDRVEMVYDPANAPTSARPDWRPDKGRAGSDPDRLCREALDAFGSSTAICNCLSGVIALHDERLAAALCSALNDWIAHTWLDHDARLRASIVISLQNAELAAAEIERCAADRRFVQVLVLAMGELPLGRSYHWPVFRAAEALGLPLGIHAGSLYRHAPTAGGWPTTLLGDYVAQSQGMQAQLLNLIAEGVFARFPALKIVLLESGVTWLPAFLWRADKTWRALRIELPFVHAAPSEIVRSNVRATVQPLDAPDEPGQLERLIELVGSDEMFLFATDYPHWHFDGIDPLPPGLSAPLRHKLLAENARATYDRLQEKLP
jgi:predicted TIM-barrel fold metal-dependent hydrolase